jgi:hypothetical protein
MKKALKILGFVALVIIIAMQFFRVDKNTPTVIASNSFQAIMQPPANLHELMVLACYDCHSYDSKYPWYSNIAPISWFLQNHIVEGRDHLNFSTWGDYAPSDQKELLEEMAKEIQEGKMPLKSYTIIHKDALLSATEQSELVSWLSQNGNTKSTKVKKQYDED